MRSAARVARRRLRTRPKGAPMDAGSPSDSAYWNPRHEAMPRQDLDALQVHKLRDLVDWTIAKVPRQAKRLAEAGVTSADQIRSLEGPKDWEWIAEMWCYGLWGFGVRPTDTLFVAFGYSTFIGFWGLHYAGEKLGCLTLPGGAMTTDARVKTIVDTGATVVASTPTYALRMAQEARSLGIDLASSTVDKVVLSGEPAGSIPATKKLIEEQWGAKAGDTAGVTELGTIMIFECSEQPGGTHLIEDHYVEEVVDPATDEPVPYGEMGERVVTSFGRGFIPVLRYRTRDFVVRVPGSNCSCGRTFDIFEGGIRGRVDDMKLVRGTNVYPRAVEAIVREHPEIDEFQIHLFTRDAI